MTVYPIMVGATTAQTGVPNAQTQVVEPSNSGLFTGLGQQWQGVLNGVGSCSATVKLLGSNDKINWSAIGSDMTLTAASADLVPGLAAVETTNPFKYFTAYVSAISGTNAAVGLNLNA